MSNYSEETAHSINGVNGRLFARHIRPDNPAQFSTQKWISEGRTDRIIQSGYGPNARIHAEIRFDDECGNGKAHFSVTGRISSATRRDDNGSMGYAHDDIARAFPELKPLIRWHLFDHFGPMHYISNVVYMAGNRDCYGLLKDERRQIFKGGDPTKPCWILRDENGNPPPGVWSNSYDGDLADAPKPPVLSWQSWDRVGEGKERNLDAARRIAVWPDATDKQLESEPAELKAMLEARLPALIAEFRADMESAGLLWSPE